MDIDEVVAMKRQQIRPIFFIPPDEWNVGCLLLLLFNSVATDEAVVGETRFQEIYKWRRNQPPNIWSRVVG